MRGARVLGGAGGRRPRRPALASMIAVTAARRGASAKAASTANAISSPGMPGRQAARRFVLLAALPSFHVGLGLVVMQRRRDRWAPFLPLRR